MPEEWRHVPGLPLYVEASSLGKIRGSYGTSRLFTLTFHKHYYVVSIRGKQYKVHRLVCAAFYGHPKKGMLAAHRNGVSTDNRASNLYWATHAQNVRDAIRHGTFARGRHPLAKLREGDIQDIRRRRKAGEMIISIHRSYPYVCYATISHVCNNRNWKQRRKPVSP